MIDFLMIDRWRDHISQLFGAQILWVKKVDQHTSPAPRKWSPKGLCMDICTHLVGDLVEQYEMVLLKMFMQ